MKYFLGLDVGGTNLAAGVVDEEYHLISKLAMPTGAGRKTEEIVEDMERLSRMVIEKSGVSIHEFETWGIGMPSYVNPKTGLLVHANCFGWKNMPIYSYLENRLPMKVMIENDANCAALGETLAGAARWEDNVIMLTLGTGVGGGIIMDRKIYCGADFMGAELGHAKLVYGGIPCTCGQKGCVESYCSATALIRQTREAALKNRSSLLWDLCEGNLSQIEGKTLFEAVKQKDPSAGKVLNQYVEYLSSALSTYIVLFRPDKIILGGGIAEAGELLLAPLRERLVPNTFAGTEIGVPEVVKAELGNDAGIIGAAFLDQYGVNRFRR